MTLPGRVVDLNGNVVHEGELLSSTFLCPGQVFEIPNAVYYFAFAKFGIFGEAYAGMAGDVRHLRELGFLVLRDTAPAMSPEQFLEAVGGLSDAKELHGLLALSHGTNSSLTGPQGNVWRVLYDDIEEAANYGLGLVIINACGSSQGAAQLCSGRGICKGHVGRYDPSDGWAWLIGEPPGADGVRAKDVIKPGQQGTRLIPRVRSR